MKLKNIIAISRLRSACKEYKWYGLFVLPYLALFITHQATSVRAVVRGWYDINGDGLQDPLMICQKDNSRQWYVGYIVAEEGQQWRENRTYNTSSFVIHRLTDSSEYHPYTHVPHSYRGIGTTHIQINELPRGEKELEVICSLPGYSDETIIKKQIDNR